MTNAADRVAVGGAITVAVAAVIGGAFYPGPRLVVGLLLAVLLGWLGSQREQLSLAADEWTMLAFVGCGVVSAVLVSMAPLASRETLAGWFVAWCLWIAARRTGSKAAALAAMILVAAALLVAVGVGLEAVGQGDLRVGGLLESPNVAAALMVVSVPLVGVLRGAHQRGWLVMIVVALVGGVGLTGSRAGLLAILATGVALLPRGRGRRVVLVTGAGAVAAILAWRFMSQPEVLAWFRPSIWSGVLRLWSRHPLLGVGPGGLADAAGPVRLLHGDHVGHHQFLITYAESSPLGLLVQTGAAGMIIAVAGAFLWLRQARANGALDILPLRSAVVGMTVMAAFHDFLNIDIVLWWWAVSFGLIEAGRRTPPEASAIAATAAWSRPVRGLAVALIVLWGIVQPASARRLWHSDSTDSAVAARAEAAEPWFDAPLEWRVRSLLDQPTWTWQDGAEALATGREAARIHPGASRLWLILGQVQYRIINEFGPWPDSISGARAAFARATELEPYQPWPWLEWARLERGLGQLDESATLVRRALAVEPNAVRAWLFLARVELDRGDMRLAREAFESAEKSSELKKRSGLSLYEKELLAAPIWQFEEIREALR